MKPYIVLLGLIISLSALGQSSITKSEPLKHRHQTMRQVVDNTSLRDLKSKFRLGNDAQTKLYSQIESCTNLAQINQFESHWSKSEIVKARKQVSQKIKKKK